MESVEILRLKLLHEEIARRLFAFETKAKIARELNLRHNKLVDILHSDGFINYLGTVGTEDAINTAKELVAEKKSLKISDADQIILSAKAEAARELLSQMQSADKDSDRRAAAIAIIELARKAEAEGKDSGTVKHFFPAAQLKVMTEAAREMDGKRHNPNDGPGANVLAGVPASG